MSESDIALMRDRLRAGVASRETGARKPPSIQPIYDDVYFAGARWIDDLARSEPSDLDVEEAPLFA